MVRRALTLCLFAVIFLALTPVGCAQDENNINEGSSKPPMEEEKEDKFLTPYKLREIPIRDPFIFADKKTKTYYLLGAWNRPQENYLSFVVFKSKNLIDWSEKITIYSSDMEADKQTDFWAPEMHEVDGTYYLFATFGPDGGFRRTQILKSDSPEGEFKVCGKATVDGIGCLDATLYCEDGKFYSIFCEEWVTRPKRDGLMSVAELQSDFKNITPSTKRVLFNAADYALKIDGDVINNSFGYITDGCFMYRNRYGELFMLWSTFSGSIGNGVYVLTYAKSSNGKISGEWILSEKNLYESDGGHGMIFEDFTGKTLITFHTPNSNVERPVIYELDDSVRGELRLGKRLV